MSRLDDYPQRFPPEQRVRGMEMPDYATYAQVIATLFIAIAIESGSRIPGASAADAESVQKRVPKEIARREWASAALLIALLAFMADLIVLTTSLPRDMISLQVGLAWFNVLAIGGMALLTIFGWYWQLNVIKENRNAEQEATRRAAEGHGGE